MTTSTGPTVVDFPLRTPEEPLPLSQYAGHRRHSGLVQSHLPNGVPIWLVTRHEDVRAVLTHPKISANPDNEGFPNVGETMGVPKQDQIPGWFVGLDSPEHDRFRKVLIPEFTVRRVRELRPAVERIVDERIDAMLAGGNTADLVNDFALPVPSLVISSLLGVPPADRDFFESRTRTLVAIRSSTDEQRATATRQLLRYINRLIAIKDKWRGDDLISRLLSTGQLSHEELSGVLLLLLIAGHETTANNIGLGVVTLLSHPQWAGDERAVEELLRLHSVADMVALRVAVDDVEIAGQTIRKGEGIVPLLAAANHDTEVFGCPHAFDPERSERRHVAFGYGVHQCLGQNLVRVEMDIAYRKLFERIPTLELAVPLEELAFKYDGILFGLHELPVRW
ncbi:cytochrome P450 monooxygenase [Streptomyces sp. DSM 42143]|uniref:cytochrome P450 n=1 Tax=Streptomyces TaxID=1883 RepID=UPI0025B328A2|nr:MULTISPECIES: cytochrome P450 [unclassified Streptomyces]MDN3248036.1 cytochrome P450 [Streptomyces sp. ZSW22]MDN3258026.1 cytochrome P450 [Streptomyces sp. MA25(2023)]MDQ0389889.1 cytochrome P450 monooxygenase [Streptomyces sp. DSM 42143]